LHPVRILIPVIDGPRERKRTRERKRERERERGRAIKKESAME